MPTRRHGAHLNIANGIREFAIATPHGVAIVLGNRLEYPEIAAGLAKAGLPSVPINPRLVAAEMEYILRHSAAKAVILDDALAAAVSPGIASCRIGHVLS